MITEFLARLITFIDRGHAPCKGRELGLETELRKLRKINSDMQKQLQLANYVKKLYERSYEQERYMRKKLMAQYQSNRTKWKTHYPVFQSIRDRASNAGIPTIRPKQSRPALGIVSESTSDQSA